MSDILEELAKSVRQRRVTKKAPIQKSLPKVQVDRSGHIRGQGGVVFDFQNTETNPLIKSYNNIMNQNADPQQIENARAQKMQHDKALHEFVAKGEYQFRRDQEQSSQGWDDQFSKSLDKQVVDMIEKEGLGMGTDGLPTGEFSKSQIKMGKDNITATSETDAAIIEMMKNGQFED